MTETEVDTSRCGTYAGFNIHRRRRESACEDCRVARNRYVKELRRRKPDIYEAAKRRDRARERALWELGRLHHDEFTQLFINELERGEL